MPMMSEIRAQAGTQSVYTTPVTPTVMIRGIEEMPLKDANDNEVIGDMTQALAGGDIGIVNGLNATGSMKGWACYEHLPYWLDNLFGQATPSGAGPYTRAYAAPTTTAPAPRILTLVKGDSTVGAYRMTGALLSNFTMRLEPKKRLAINGDLMGVSLGSTTLAALTASSSINVIKPDHVGATGLKLDAWAGTMGSTTLTNCTLRFMELNIKPDRASRWCLGNLAAQSYVEKPWDGTLKLGLEFNATTKADVDAIVGGTLTQKQFQATISPNANLSLLVQFAGTVVDDLEIFSDDDGVVTVEMTLQRTYHATFGNWCKMTVINGISGAAMV